MSDSIMSNAVLYVGLDVHKDSIEIAVAESGRDAEVRLLGDPPVTCPPSTRLSRSCAPPATLCASSMKLGRVVMSSIVTSPNKVSIAPSSRLQ